MGLIKKMVKKIPPIKRLRDERDNYAEALSLQHQENDELVRQNARLHQENLNQLAYTYREIVKRKYRYLDRNSEETLKTIIIKTLAESELLAHLYGRLESKRNNEIPWIESFLPLFGSRILEIGCGTGCFTVPLSEQGANVLAIDIIASHMDIAKKRCDLYGLNADFRTMNATEIDNKLKEEFDCVIFSASLEHMTYEERIQSIRAACNIVKKNGYVVVIETPNRLWIKDFHTSLCEFFHWLPDEVAIDYAKFTDRANFNESFNNLKMFSRSFHDSSAKDEVLPFLRWGRGVSYHEFQIALNRKEPLTIASSMSSFFNHPWDSYKIELKKYGPSYIHDAFYDPDLNIALSIE